MIVPGVYSTVTDPSFPTVSFAAESVEEVYQLTEEEENVMEGLQMAFVNSIRLRQHIDFLYKKGSMYRIFNDNLLYHGCVPLDESGNFDGVVFGKRCYRGREYLDYAEHVARRAWLKEAKEKGYNSAFLIAFKNGEKINIQEAFK